MEVLILREFTCSKEDGSRDLAPGDTFDVPDRLIDALEKGGYVRRPPALVPAASPRGGKRSASPPEAPLLAPQAPETVAGEASSDAAPEEAARAAAAASEPAAAGANEQG
ncbi:hypothetical protein [Methylosinus sp. LW4]|uniref:hypothetical protein n=1 Tax=Methylosinus sp. LW4 TaxID=136993 RepID=UPI000381BE07|nr:hypothetical protein [Methylosinus sp. LW4]